MYHLEAKYVGSIQRYEHAPLRGFPTVSAPRHSPLGALEPVMQRTGGITVRTILERDQSALKLG